MSGATLEHVNVAVSDPQETAHMLCRLFDWEIRWRGELTNGKKTVHVGSKGSYVVLYSHEAATNPVKFRNLGPSGMNHISVVVENLDVVKARVKAAGFIPESHSDEAEQRFHFHDHDNIDYEVIAHGE
ncbi:MAG: glyoxalase [Rhodobacteraceae bacterium]|nr:MAG: glyoxalase [Paracoccaceae bacterium]